MRKHIIFCLSMLVPLAAWAQSATPPTKASTGYVSFTTNPGGYGYRFLDTQFGIQILGMDQGADGINASCKQAPVAPYSVVAHFSLNTWVGGVNGAANQSGGGLAW